MYVLSHRCDWFHHPYVSMSGADRVAWGNAQPAVGAWWYVWLALPDSLGWAQGRYGVEVLLMAGHNGWASGPM